MKGQWGLLFALFFALIVAIFAVINVEAVTVDYLFGVAEVPLVLVIFVSALIGGMAVGGFGIFHVLRMRRENRHLIKRNNLLENELQMYTDQVIKGKPEQERASFKPTAKQDNDPAP